MAWRFVAMLRVPEPAASCLLLSGGCALAAGFARLAAFANCFTHSTNDFNRRD